MVIEIVFQGMKRPFFYGEQPSFLTIYWYINMAKKQDWIIGFFLFGAVAVFVFFIFMIVLGVIGSSSEINFSGAGEKVGVVELNGVITSSQRIVRQLKKFDKDANIKAVVFRIDSPGGGIAASQEIYEQVKRTRDHGKPIIASMGSVAASGGYYVSLGASKIMANPGTTTGSIGVIAEIPNFKKLLDKIGVQFTIIKSGKYKDIGSPYREVTGDELYHLQRWIDNGYDQFVRTIVNERHLQEQRVREIGDGRVYSGEQALGLALIDSLGTFDDAIQWAGKMGGIKGEPKVYRERQKRVTVFDLVRGDIGGFVRNNFGTWPRVKYQMVF